MQSVTPQARKSPGRSATTGFLSFQSTNGLSAMMIQAEIFQPSSSTFQWSQARENSHFCEWKSSTCLGCYRILNPDPEIRLARNPSHTHCWCSFGPVLGALVSNSLLLWTKGGCKSENFPLSLLKRGCRSILKRGCAVDSRVIKVVKEPTELLLPD